MSKIKNNLFIPTNKYTPHIKYRGNNVILTQADNPWYLDQKNDNKIKRKYHESYYESYYESLLTNPLCWIIIFILILIIIDMLFKL